MDPVKKATSRRALIWVFPLIPLLFGMVAVEVAVGVTRLVVCEGQPPTFSQPDSRFGWMHTPGSSGRAFACLGSAYEYSIPFTFNSKGLRAREYPYDRVAGNRRVLVLGDSVTEALQVSQRDGFSERLERMFAADGKAVEVINSGHSGFGTDNEVFFYESEGRRYAADVVLLVFNLQNDIAENAPAVSASRVVPPTPDSGHGERP